MVTIFLDQKGVKDQNTAHPKTTVNSEYYFLVLKILRQEASNVMNC